jgi:acyl carrier protein
VSERAVREIIALIAVELEIPESRLSAASSTDTTPEWDSVGHLNICLAIQDRYGVSLDMDAIGELTSVAALAALIDKT